MESNEKQEEIKSRFTPEAIDILWDVFDLLVRPEEKKHLRGRMEALSEKNDPYALKEMLYLGYRVGIFFMQDTFDKEGHFRR